MRNLLLAGLLMVVALGLISGAQEIGARLRLDEGGVSAGGWVAHNGEWGGVELSGRGEWDLLPATFRSLSGSARLPWTWGSVRGTVHHAFGGRTQVVGQFELELSVPSDPVGLSFSGGSQSRITMVRGSMSTSLGTWASLRAQRGWWWGEVRADAGWPWVDLGWSAAVGVDTASWVRVHVNGHDLSVEGAGLEMGGASGPWSTSATVSLLPTTSHSVTVRWGEEAFRIHARLRVRGGRAWSAQTGAAGRMDHMRWSLQFDLGPTGWHSASLELRLTL